MRRTQPNLKDLSPVWPLPILNGSLPAVVGRRLSMPGAHLGYDADVSQLVPVFAVAHGRVIYAKDQPHGNTVIVDHLNGWATYYTNLEHLRIAPRTMNKAPASKVRAGDVLGYMDPSKRGGEQCLYFELWERGDDCHFSPADVTEHVRSWAFLPWTDVNPSDSTSMPVAA